MTERVLERLWLGHTPQQIAAAMPRWLEIETAYANGVYGDNNPQRGALDGKLLDRSDPAYQEYALYLGRFAAFFRNAAAEDTLSLVRASQALGKLTTTSRSLVRATMGECFDVSTQRAEKLSHHITSQLSTVITTPCEVTAERVDTYLEATIEPRLAHVHDAIKNGDSGSAWRLSGGLLLSTMKLSVDFTYETGILASPGVPSQDEQNLLGVWSPEYATLSSDV